VCTVLSIDALHVYQEVWWDGRGESIPVGKRLLKGLLAAVMVVPGIWWYMYMYLLMHLVVVNVREGSYWG